VSLESGKKLGFAASIINIIVPVIMGVVFVVFYAALFGAILSASRAASGGVVVTPAISSLVGVFTSLIVIGVVGSALALAGYILFLIAMHRLSQYYKEPSIFSNLLRALIIQIVTAVIFGVIVVVMVLLVVGSVPIRSGTVSVQPLIITSFLGVIVASLVWFAISIYCAVLYKRSFDRLTEKSGVDSFKTTGLLYLIGAVLNIAGGIGAIILWIAWIFAALGYQKLQPLPPASAPFVPPYQPGTVAVKRCPTCGADNSPDAIYCRNCGRLL
jgi:uncharacterized membrane protein